MSFFSGYFTRRLYWHERREWTKQQNAEDRAARLAAKYTPRELRRAAKADELDRTYRFTRDSMRDALDAGFMYRKDAQRVKAGFQMLDQNTGALGDRRLATLNIL